MKLPQWLYLTLDRFTIPSMGIDLLGRLLPKNVGKNQASKDRGILGWFGEPEKLVFQLALCLPIT
jgi:hypothetical protein